MADVIKNGCLLFLVSVVVSACTLWPSQEKNACVKHACVNDAKYNHLKIQETKIEVLQLKGAQGCIPSLIKEARNRYRITESEFRNNASVVSDLRLKNLSYFVQQTERGFDHISKVTDCSKRKIISENVDGDKMMELYKDVEIIRILLNSDSQFTTGSYELLPQYKASLTSASEYIKNIGDYFILVSGHTDDVGSALENKKLSEKRAESVKEFLTGKGVSGKYMKIESLGENLPHSENVSKTGRLSNRRVEVLFELVNDVKQEKEKYIPVNAWKDFLN